MGPSPSTTAQSGQSQDRQDRRVASSSSPGMGIVRVSLCERLRMCFLALAFGWYLVLRRLIRWAWDPQQFFRMRPRDKPPACLVDDSLGRHSYVKLKVRKKTDTD
ncbi:hypothetical protein QAD02_017301 [Eretmocerus hayati]|uniref:Uncharacterized protein n=1 Tax=Eretmocerus hayati TaxID=131215 RepID=A0ACC2PDX1_9HYME|nr:hypothetical protein QAD02_017301 [Eretmocerus hayati]